jgi:hypothetical protein
VDGVPAGAVGVIGETLGSRRPDPGGGDGLVAGVEPLGGGTVAWGVGEEQPAHSSAASAATRLVDVQVRKGFSFQSRRSGRVWTVSMCRARRP